MGMVGEKVKRSGDGRGKVKRSGDGRGKGEFPYSGPSA